VPGVAAQSRWHVDRQYRAPCRVDRSDDARRILAHRTRQADAEQCVDDDVDARDWKEVVWAITTRVDPLRDTTLVDRTPIDYLDFASPVSGLGSKMGIDATHKWPGETDREWGRPIAMDAEVRRRVDAMWGELGL